MAVVTGGRCVEHGPVRVHVEVQVVGGHRGVSHDVVHTGVLGQEVRALGPVHHDVVAPEPPGDGSSVGCCDHQEGRATLRAHYGVDAGRLVLQGDVVIKAANDILVAYAFAVETPRAGDAEMAVLSHSVVLVDGFVITPQELVSEVLPPLPSQSGV